MPQWRNWQTRTVQGRVPHGVEVQLLSAAHMGYNKEIGGLAER